MLNLVIVFKGGKSTRNAIFKIQRRQFADLWKVDLNDSFFVLFKDSSEVTGLSKVRVKDVCTSCDWRK